jgi:putative membrane protein (TIGR04086 family)
MAKKQGGKAIAMPVGIALGIMVAVVITLLGAILLTSLIAGEKMELEALGYGIMAIQFLGGIIGAVTAMLAIKRQKMQVCLLTGLGYFLVLLASNALFFGGQYEGVLTTGLILLAGCSITAILGSREARGRNRGRRKPVYR